MPASNREKRTMFWDFILRRSSVTPLDIPYWFIVCLSVAFAAAPWIVECDSPSALS